MAPRRRAFGWAGLLLTFEVLGTFRAAALDWQTGDGYRRAMLIVPASGKAGFAEVGPAVTGITFTNRLAEERSITNQIFLNGSGVAAGDIDGDGLCDLYFCGLDSPNALYRNLGNWRFEEITAAAGVACADQASTAAAFADVDGDGDLDLLVSGINHGTRLFLNDGHGRFHEVTAAAGLSGTSGSTSLTLADIDGDGFLDLYVVNYRNDTMRDLPDMRFRFFVTNGVQELLTVNGRPAGSPEFAGRFSFDGAGGILENGEADRLFRNDGKGRFIAQSWTNGLFLDEAGRPIQTPYDWGLSAMFRDLNGDGAPDLYVCNDFQSPDRIWINDGHGRFQAIGRNAIRQTSLFSMGVDVADINRDGYDDIFVADMLSPDHARRQVQVMDAHAFAQFRNTASDRPQFPRNMLFLNRGNGTYSEIAQLAQLDASDWSWCPVFLDVDLDGYEDLLITTGHWRDAQHVDISREIEDAKKRQPLSPIDQLRLRRRFPRLNTPNAAFRNRGDLTFAESGRAWGFDSRRICQGMALADLDNDGDLDVAINCLNDGPLILRNETSAPRVAVRLRGKAPNTRGIGAKVRLLAPGLPSQSQEFICGGRYLSSDDSMRVFAAGEASNVTVEVTWRSGMSSRFTNIPANHLIEIEESSASLAKAGEAATDPRPLFEDVSQRLGHLHRDEPFDDFARQPLLPHKLSELGPGVAWFDFNGDGWDDLIVGAGRGGRLGVFRNDGHGGFVPQRAKMLEAPADRDLTAILGWLPDSNHLALLIGLATYESAETNGPAVSQVSLTTGEQENFFTEAGSSCGPLAMADFDGDGDLDLFVGGRVIGGRYPEAASSVLLRNDNGRLQLDIEASAVFRDVGLVSGAVFADLDADGWPELVLACEWGPLRIFKNDHGKFRPWDAPLTGSSSNAVPRASLLSQLSGWWTSVAAGDFDNDGRLDLVAGNWGRNHSRARFASKPVHLFFGAPDSTGNLGLIEAWHDPVLQKLVPARALGALEASFPVLHNRFPTFASMSAAGIDDLLSAGLPPMREVTAATFDSMVFLNRGDHFEVRPLPVEAQLSGVFGIAVGDFDGDGAEDVFAAQNFFGVSPAESRNDAGCGLLLRGDGHGGFQAVPARESGLAIYGQGRGVAICDFDHDGRMDVAVGENRGPTRLYHNVGARPGLRTRLEGLEKNPQAIGASARLRFRSGRMGPVHEIHLGSGYWSQDSTEFILGLPEPAAELEIRWPGGAVERVPISAETRPFIRVVQRR